MTEENLQQEQPGSAAPEQPAPSTPSEPAVEQPRPDATSTAPSADASAQDQEDASFAELLAAQEDSGPSTRLEPGQRVQAKVVAVTADTVFVSTGSKVDGIVDKAELEQDGVSEVQVGDVIDLYVVHASPQEVRLSKVVRGAGSLSALEDAKEARLPVEGKVVQVVKGGFAVDIMRRRGFCPISQMDLRPVEDQESLIGKSYKFLITKLENKSRNIVLSRRAILEAEQAENRDAFLATVNDGDVLEGTVTRLTAFGAFVELAPGVEGLVHVSELSWSRVQKPDEVFSPGDKVRVKLLSVSKEAKGVKISLSVRQVSEAPWTTVGDRIKAGDTVTGKVVRFSSFGAFIEVLPGIEGLAHISELSWEKRVNKAEDVLSIGEQIQVRVKEVDADKRRVSLSVRDAAGDPWADVEEQFPLNSEHTGRVEKRAAFGIFINLAPGITGLMPNSFYSHVQGKAKLEKLAPGDEVLITVREMDIPARKITIGPAGEDAEETPFERKERGKGEKSGDRGDRAGGRKAGGRPPRDRDSGEWKAHAGKAAAPLSFGSLGDALAAAMKKKESK